MEEAQNYKKLIALQFDGRDFTVSSLELLISENRTSLKNRKIPSSSFLIGVFNSVSEAEDYIEYLDDYFEKKFGRGTVNGQ